MSSRSKRALRWAVVSASTSVAIETLENRTLLNAVLTDDLNTETLDSSPTHVTNVNGVAFFDATTPQLGQELYKSDGTAAGTKLVKDIDPGTGSSSPNYLTALGSKVIFSAYDPTNGTSLWASDGTTAGTILLKKGSNPSQLIDVGSTVYFYGYDSTSGQYGLMSTNGTAAGTKVIKGGLYINAPMAAIGSTLYFDGFDSTANFGYELYTSNGTTAGTKLLKDIAVGTQGSNPQHLTVAGTTLFFSATDAFGDTELYKSNGTAAGTGIVKNINATSSSSPQNLTAVGSKLFFTASDSPATNSLWISDGTSTGTKIVKSGIYPSQLVAAGGKLFFEGYDTTEFQYELFKSDGTPTGTVRVESAANSGSYSPQDISAVGTGVYFYAYKSGTTTDGLWKSDGTSGGTVLVKDIVPGTSDYIANITGVGTKVFFSATTPQYGNELWVTDGTSAGTHLTADINTNTQPSTITKLVALPNGEAIFIAYDPINAVYDLYRTNGTPAGTILLHAKLGSTSELAAVGNKAFFVAAGTSAPNYQEIWVTDGTVAGTKQVDSSTGGSYQPGNLASGNGVVYFNAYQYTGGTYGLWDSNGSTTTLLKTGLYTSNATAGDHAVIGSEFYFQGYQTTGTNYGYELYKSNGTAAGTVLVKDIAVGTQSSSPTQLTPVGTTLFFTATDAFGDTELYKSNGTSAGTSLVKNINPTTSSSITQMTPVGTELYFVATDGTGYSNEVWKSDGTAAGTVKIRAKLIGYQLTNFNGTLVFYGSDYAAAKYNMLFKSTGTSAGTTIISPSTLTSVTGPLTTVQGRIFFAGYNPSGTTGTELWESNGTSSGTKLIKDINPGPNSSNPLILGSSGNDLYFSADDGVHGTELWTVQPPTAVAGTYTVVEGTSTVLLNGGGSTDIDPTESLTYSWDLNGNGIFGETGSAATNGNETGKTPTYKITGTGVTKSISLKVTNSVGLTSIAVSTGTVKIVPKAATGPSDSVTNHHITINWKNNSMIASSVKILRSIDGTTFSLLKTLAANVITYTDSTTTAGKQYWYEVVATDAAGDGAALKIGPITA
jgi:ELWxxDGT repeat protein